MRSASLPYFFCNVGHALAWLHQHVVSGRWVSIRFCKVQVMTLAVTFTSHRASGRRVHLAKRDVCPQSKCPHA